jgi:hypothetical protein
MSAISTEIQYTDDPKADLAIIIPDGTVFRVQRQVLAYHSDVYADAFEVGTDAQAEREPGTDLVIVRLTAENPAEEGRIWDMVLRLICKGQKRPDLSAENFLDVTKYVPFICPVPDEVIA